MNKQQIFDTCIRHMRIQKKPSMIIGPTNYCAYRGDDNRKCIVGVLIPDEMYDEDMDDGTNTDIERNTFVQSILEDTGIKIDNEMILFLSDLQDVHDTIPIRSEWGLNQETRMKQLSEVYNLKYSPVE